MKKKLKLTNLQQESLNEKLMNMIVGGTWVTTKTCGSCSCACTGSNGHDMVGDDTSAPNSVSDSIPGSHS